MGPRAADRAPHILFILADDLGYNDVGFHQSRVSGANPQGLPTVDPASRFLTPTLDALVGEGLLLDSYYTQPLCSPTRATIMTGRYPFHTGMGPDVQEIHQPYGLPARETLLPELLKKAGNYTTAAIGKWHLGACSEGYMPTARGFDSFVGYLSGAQSYFNHVSDFRNGTASSPGGETCVGDAVEDVYSAGLYAREAARIVGNHDDERDGPLFMYLAFQNVHNPYDAPPPTLIDINATYASIEDYDLRVYAGMVTALDMAVKNVTDAFRDAGIWDETLLIFSTDNGGIGPGNNYPLRGSKVNDWEGGIRGVGLVRGPELGIPVGARSSALMHTTDWLPTLCGLAPGDDACGLESLPLALDGVDQWSSLVGTGPPARNSIVHNAVPPAVFPVNISTPDSPNTWSTSTCLSAVDNATGPCHAFGIIGGAVRRGDWKLLSSGDLSAGLESNTPPGIAQYTPAGFTPTTNDTIPSPFNGTLWLFNITADPTETHNLAADEPAVLESMLSFLDEAAASAVPDAGWRFGFTDPRAGPDPCWGPTDGSAYCAFGHEFDCFVFGSGLVGGDISQVVVSDPGRCHAECRATDECAWWVWQNGTTTESVCRLKSSRGDTWACPDCTLGPRTCPGDPPQEREREEKLQVT